LFAGLALTSKGIATESSWTIVFSVPVIRAPGQDIPMRDDSLSLLTVNARINADREQVLMVCGENSGASCGHQHVFQSSCFALPRGKLTLG
jgi:hypothetical protein